MLFLYPATLILALSKLLLLCVLTTHDISSYVGITAVDAGLRIAHIATYVTLSRSGLQLPVSAFLPAPEPLGATDVVLYAAPAVAATWRSSAGVFERMSSFAMALRVTGSQAVGAIRQRLSRYLELTVHTHPVALLASERTYYLDQIRWPPCNWSFVLTPTSTYPASTPIPAPPASSTGSSDICLRPVLGACAVGIDTPDPAIDLERRRRNLALLDELEGPTSLIVYEPPPHTDHFALGPHIPRLYIIIHVRACLVGLLVACCAIYAIFICIKLTLRLVLRLARSVYNLAHTLFMSGCSMAKYLLGMVFGLLADIWGKLWRLVLEAHIFCATRTKTLPVAPSVEVDKPEPVGSLRKKNRKRKKKGSKGSTAVPPPLLPPVLAPVTATRGSPHFTPPTTLGDQTLAVGEPGDNEGGEWTGVTRTRKARRAPTLVTGGQPNFGLRGGLGRK